MEKPVIATSSDVVAYIQKRLIEENKGDQKFRLIKLTYACYAWTLVASNNQARLFSEHPQAWGAGPVFPTIWREDSEIYFKPYSNELDANVKGLIDKVLSLYEKDKNEDLHAVFHADSAWRKARGSKSVFDRSSAELDDDQIFAYYSSLYKDSNG